MDHAAALFSTVVVSPASDALSSGDALLAAVAGLAPGKPWLVKIEPGTYDLNHRSLDVGPLVSVEGSGEAATKITSDVYNYQPTVRVNGAPDGSTTHELRFLTVEQRSDVGHTIHINDPATLFRVTLLRSVNSTSTAISIYLTASFTAPSSLVLDSVTIPSPQSSAGYYAAIMLTPFSSSLATLHNVTAHGPNPVVQINSTGPGGTVLLKIDNCDFRSDGSSTPGHPPTVIENNSQYSTIQMTGTRVNGAVLDNGVYGGGSYFHCLGTSWLPYDGSTQPQFLATGCPSQ